jgi:hypothetical protein
MKTWFAPPRAYLSLFLLTLMFRIATALPLTNAGYMDASYAMHVAENLARGRGFIEEVLWNYLDNPAGLPHPSNLYWMPLPSILIAPLYALLGVSYRAAQIPFVVLSSLVPLVAFYVARRIFARDDYAWTAALFTAFSGFYTIYWVSPDNFTPFALTASLCLVFIARGVEREGERARERESGGAKERTCERAKERGGGKREFFIAGIFAGLSHLARADGLLLVVIAPLGLYALRTTQYSSKVSGFKFSRFAFYVLHLTVSCLLPTAYFLLGYLLVMTPWFARNYLAIGAVLPRAGTRTLWLTSYDELFRFTDDLTWQRYLDWGIGNIVASKLRAAWVNFLVIAFGALQIFLAPFALIGLWHARRRVELFPFFVYAPLLYLAMVLAFTFPSMRGSMLHSAAALLPFFAAVAPRGIDAAVEWIARRRRAWNAAQAARVFRIGFVALAIFLAVYLYALGVFPIGGGASDIPLWNLRDIEYVEIARWLDAHARADDVVMVVDPPAFYNLSHRRSIVIPTDSIEAIFLAARKYNARYLVLQFDHPKPLNDVYRGTMTVPDLVQVAEFRDGNNRPVMLFEVTR